MRQHHYIVQACLFMILLMGGALYARPTETPTSESFKKTLIFKKHQFDISTSDAGAVRELVIRVSRDNAFLMTIRQKTDGWVVNAEAGDLDQNNAPEIYIYSCTYGSGAFGKVYAFQFFPDFFDKIHTTPLSADLAEGYMGHDSFMIEDNVLIRKFPIYHPGDTNAKPTGGIRTINYKLEEVEKRLILTPKSSFPEPSSLPNR